MSAVPLCPLTPVPVDLGVQDGLQASTAHLAVGGQGTEHGHVEFGLPSEPIIHTGRWAASLCTTIPRRTTFSACTMSSIDSR